MTDLSAEERARECLARAMEQHGGDARLSCAADIRADKGSEYWSVPIRALIAFEAAAIERAAQVAHKLAALYPEASEARQCAMNLAAAIRQLHSGEGAGDQQ